MGAINYWWDFSILLAKSWHQITDWLTPWGLLLTSCSASKYAIPRVVSSSKIDSTNFIRTVSNNNNDNRKTIKIIIIKIINCMYSANYINMWLWLNVKYIIIIQGKNMSKVATLYLINITNFCTYLNKSNFEVCLTLDFKVLKLKIMFQNFQ